nr:hypothetical protein Iba_chr04cCG17480 [Ipomoea batatas]
MNRRFRVTSARGGTCSVGFYSSLHRDSHTTLGHSSFHFRNYPYVNPIQSARRIIVPRSITQRLSLAKILKDGESAIVEYVTWGKRTVRSLHHADDDKDMMPVACYFVTVLDVIFICIAVTFMIIGRLDPFNKI